MNKKENLIPIKAASFKVLMRNNGYYPFDKNDNYAIADFIKEFQLQATPEEIRSWFNARKRIDISSRNLSAICHGFNVSKEDLIDSEEYQKRQNEKLKKKSHDSIKITNKEEFAAKLRDLVSDKGITHEEFADKIQQKKDTVEKWFQAQSMPQLWDLMEICKAFKVDLDYFMGRITEKNHDTQTVCDITGLSPAAVDTLIKHREEGRSGRLEGISLLLADETDIIYHVLNCISAFRLKEDITIDILPEGYNAADLFIEDYEEAYSNSKEYEACRVNEYKDKGILTVSKPGAKIFINEQHELTKKLIRQTRINELTSALLKLSEKIEKNPRMFG